MDPFIASILIASLIFSFFFSGMEIAFLSANRLHIELQEKQGTTWGRIMSKFMNKQSWFIGTTLIGNTLALVVFGVYMAQWLTPLLKYWLPAGLNTETFVLFIQTIISTLVIIISVEFLPKSLFLINPNVMLAALAIPFNLMFYILSPFTFSIVWLSRLFIIYVLRIPYDDEKPVLELKDLNFFLKNTDQVRHEDEEVEVNKQIFHNALEFRTVRLRDCMTPRTEIISLGHDATVDELREMFIESGHSKILIHKDTIDDVIGYCHSSALLRKPKTIDDILTPISMVPETMLGKSMLVQLIKEQKSAAIVIDEFGGTSGIVTLEDLMEEIFGEIEDEHDHTELTSKKIDTCNYEFSARHEIDYLNEHYHLDLPEGDYETLGGLILNYSEDLPDEGTSITLPPFTFTILKNDGNKIDTIHLQLDEPPKKS